MEDPQKKTEAASAALSRIVAGDFLETLGKELGLEVPPDLPPATAKNGTSVPHKDATQDPKDNDIKTSNLPSSPALNASAVRDASDRKNLKLDRTYEESPMRGGLTSNSLSASNVKLEKAHQEDRKEKYKHRSSSSEDERSRKRSRKHRHRHSSSDYDSSDESRGRHSSRSRDDRKRSSRKKHRRRKHSRHK